MTEPVGLDGDSVVDPQCDRLVGDDQVLGSLLSPEEVERLGLNFDPSLVTKGWNGSW